MEGNKGSPYRVYSRQSLYGFGEPKSVHTVALRKSYGDKLLDNRDAIQEVVEVLAITIGFNTKIMVVH